MERLRNLTVILSKNSHNIDKFENNLQDVDTIRPEEEMKNEESINQSINFSGVTVKDDWFCLKDVQKKKMESIHSSQQWKMKII